MLHPERSAFCLLLFGSNGGQFDELGRPIFRGQLGTCGRAFDCGTCPLMREWMLKLAQDGWEWGWECDQCLKNTFDTDHAREVERILPGYYQSSQPDDEDHPPIEGCTRCGWQTSFLQLILRR
jgi:hypothetical protein